MKHGRNKGQAENLSRLVLSAAFLHREFLGLRAEEKFRNDHDGKVHYAFDDDVLSSFALPWQWGPESVAEHNTNVRGYGQLLPRRSSAGTQKTKSQLKRERIDEDVRAINVVKLLCEYAFKSTAPSGTNGCILQFSPHFNETSTSIDRVRERAERHGYRNSGDVTETLFQNAVLILRAKLDPRTKKSGVVKTIQNVAEVALTRELSGPSRASMAYDNFDRMENWGERASLSSVADLGHDSDDRRQKQIHEEAFSLLMGFWTREFSNREASSEAISADAESFARLAVINKQLLDQGSPERVVLVTGSKSLVKVSYRSGERLRRYIRDQSAQDLARGLAAEEVRSNRDNWNRYFGFSNDVTERAAEFEWFDRFSLHYVRHISAFAKGALIEGPDTYKLDNLFHGLFALQSKWNRFKRSDIEKIVEYPWQLKLSFLEKDPDSLYLEVLEQWDQLTNRALEAKRSFEWEFPVAAVEYIEERFSDKLNVSAGELVGDITEQVDRQRDRSMLELSDMGARALLERGKLSVRNPPDLFFSRFSKTNAVFENLHKPNFYSSSPEKFVADFNAIDLDSYSSNDSVDGDDRQRSYLKFVVLGAVFASAEKWSTALGHALRAIRTVERYSRKPAIVKTSSKAGDAAKLSAREAYYLASVCTRMLAETKGSLSKSKQRLSQSDRAYISDVLEMPALVGILGNSRSKSEMLATELSSYYFDRWTASLDDDGRKKTCRDFEVNDIYDAAADLINELSKSADPFDGPMTPLTVVSAATNILQVATIRQFRLQDGCDDKLISDSISDDLMHSCVRKLSRKKDGFPYVETSLVRAYRNSGALILGLQDHVDLRSEPKLTLFLDLAAKQGAMLYDEWRYMALRDFLRQYYDE